MSNLEPSILAYERKLTDAIIGNQLVAQAIYAAQPFISLHLENAYSIHQSTAAGVAMILPAKNNAITAGLFTAGISSFRNWSFNIGDAMHIQKDLSVGLKLIASSTHIKNNKSLINLGYQLGMTYKISDATHCHLHFNNVRPINTTFNDNIQGIYQIHAGVAQQINPDLLVSIELDQTKGSPISLSPGILWNIQTNIQLLAGLKPLPGEVFTGIGWKRKNNHLLLLLSHHPYLGKSLAIRYTLEKK